MAGEVNRHGLGPRKAAQALLTAVLHDRQPLSDLIEDDAGPLAGLEPAQRARAQRLAATTLRHLDRADALLGPFLRKTPPLPVRNILRLAVVEHFVDGAAGHGVVNGAVELVRRGRRTAHLSGLVNAVLRQALDTAPEHWRALPSPKLPPWLRKRLATAWGRQTVAAIEAIHMQGAPLDLTLRDPATAPHWAGTLGAVVLPTNSLRLSRAGQVTNLPGFAEGAWWVQDAAAALPAQMLAPMPGERVLDLCAAPGGKTLQLAAAGAKVTAVDISGPRMKRLHENLSRTGLEADCVTADALHWEPEEDFDAVLLDAPCTATGTIRRHPDLPFVKDGTEVAGLVAFQAALIDRALGWLRPGGRLVFCTCSLLPEEGEAQARAALARHPGYVADTTGYDLPGVAPEWRSDEGGLRIRPDFWADRGGLDGFYMIRLRRGN